MADVQFKGLTLMRINATYIARSSQYFCCSEFDVQKDSVKYIHSVDHNTLLTTTENGQCVHS
jgi:hypothetical protein